MLFQHPTTFTHISDIHDAAYLTQQQLVDNRTKLDGYDEKKEALTRKGVRLFIQRLASALKLNPWVEDDAVVLVQRFFARRSYERNDRYLIAGAALFLAAKTADSTRSAKHVAHHLFRTRNANKPDELAALERNPEKKLAETGLVEALLDAERALLYTLSFNVREYHINLCLKQYLRAAQVYTLAPPPAQEEADEQPPLNSQLSMEAQKQLTSIAVKLAKDIFKTQLVCQMPPEQAAAACVRMAAGLTSVPFNPPPDAMLEIDSKLGPAFKLSDNQFQSFHAQMMELYKPASTDKQQQQQQQQQAAAAPAAPDGARQSAAAAPAAAPAAGASHGRMSLKPPPPSFRPPAPTAAAPSITGPAAGAVPVTDVGSPSDPNARSANDDANNNNNSTEAVAESAGSKHTSSLEPGELPPASALLPNGPPQCSTASQQPQQQSSAGAPAAVPAPAEGGATGGEATGPVNGFVPPHGPSRKRSAEEQSVHAAGEEPVMREAKSVRVV